MAGQCTRQGNGLLITIDEIQDASISDVREIAVAVQHIIRERQNIAFVFAGLTSGVMDLLGEDGPTFLRRAYPEELDTIPIDEVYDALEMTIEKNGMHIDHESLQRASEATAGYAYLIQLVGYHVWRATESSARLRRHRSFRLGEECYHADGWRRFRAALSHVSGNGGLCPGHVPWHRVRQRCRHAGQRIAA